MAQVSLTLSTREASLKSLDKLPRLSPLLARFLGLLAHPGCDLAELVSVVEKDALLSAQILQRANSAIFGRTQPIHSVHHAVALLGVGTMRRFALGCSVSNLFARQSTPPNFSMTRFNLHSVATGTLTELLSEELPNQDASPAFIAGLMHDIGLLLIAAHMPKQFEEVLSMAAVTGGTEIECERELLGTDHAELSAMAISRWDLEDAITIAVRDHEEPDGVGLAEGDPPGRTALTTLVRRADEFVNYLGMSVLPPRSAPPVPPSLDFAGVNAARVQQRFHSEWNNLWNLLH